MPAMVVTCVIMQKSGAPLHTAVTHAFSIVTRMGSQIVGIFRGKKILASIFWGSFILAGITKNAVSKCPAAGHGLK